MDYGSIDDQEFVWKQIVAMPCGITRDNHVISAVRALRRYLFIRKPPTSAGNFKR